MSILALIIISIHTPFFVCQGYETWERYERYIRNRRGNRMGRDSYGFNVYSLFLPSYPLQDDQYLLTLPLITLHTHYLILVHLTYTLHLISGYLSISIRTIMVTSQYHYLSLVHLSYLLTLPIWQDLQYYLLTYTDHSTILHSYLYRNHHIYLLIDIQKSNNTTLLCLIPYAT